MSPKIKTFQWCGILNMSFNCYHMLHNLNFFLKVTPLWGKTVTSHFWCEKALTGPYQMGFMKCPENECKHWPHSLRPAVFTAWSQWAAATDSEALYPHLHKAKEDKEHVIQPRRWAASLAIHFDFLVKHEFAVNQFEFLLTGPITHFHVTHSTVAQDLKHWARKFFKNKMLKVKRGHNHRCLQCPAFPSLELKADWTRPNSSPPTTCHLPILRQLFSGVLLFHIPLSLTSYKWSS